MIQQAIFMEEERRTFKQSYIYIGCIHHKIQIQYSKYRLAQRLLIFPRFLRGCPRNIRTKRH